MSWWLVSRSFSYASAFTTRDPNSWMPQQTTVFVLHPTNRRSVTQGLSKVGPDAGGSSKNASGPVGIPLKKAHLRRQVINLTPLRRVKAWGTPPPPTRLEVCPETRHTRPDPCCCYHGRPKCDPSTWSSWFLNNRRNGKFWFILCILSGP